jgi:thiol-disulfide isomerase/thioredoxin
MIKKLFLLLLLPFVSNSQIPKGLWQGEFKLNDSISLPVKFDVKGSSIEFINDRERIKVTEISYADDSLFIRMPVFDSEIRCTMKGDSLFGNFLNHARTKDNVIPFIASYGRSEPMVNSFELQNFEGRWEVSFDGDEPPLNKAIGEFSQTGNHVTGTFLTPTGDYRYLEGYADGNKLYLSCFDGSHLFYFDAEINPDDVLEGNYYSGKHWHDTWKAFRNENASLPDPDSLTFLKKGYDKISFTFPDVDSNFVSLSDKKFEGKVVVLQIMGTWCPNCMDETEYLAPFYKKYKEKGVEIIALDYERIPVFSTARKNLLRLKERYDIEYTLLFAGSTDQEKREKTLPMLSSILSFPTTIIIDKQGRVRNIHTGFSGPATGTYYEKWKEDFTGMIDKLLITPTKY